jgi:hypothetical protein
VSKNRWAADALVKDGCRHLALAETRDVYTLGDVLVGVVKAWLELLWSNLDG